jgi:hypothetical protein
MRIEQAHESGLDRYEFLGDADRHKLDWTHRVHDRVRAQLFDPTARGLAERLVWKCGRNLKGKLKVAFEFGLGTLDSVRPRSQTRATRSANAEPFTPVRFQQAPLGIKPDRGRLGGSVSREEADIA